MGHDRLNLDRKTIHSQDQLESANQLAVTRGSALLLVFFFIAISFHNVSCPSTILRWYWKLVAEKYDGSKKPMQRTPRWLAQLLLPSRLDFMTNAGTGESTNIDRCVVS